MLRCCLSSVHQPKVINVAALCCSRADALEPLHGCCVFEKELSIIRQYGVNCDSSMLTQHCCMAQRGQCTGCVQYITLLV
jgi:hypothetical protein